MRRCHLDVQTTRQFSHLVRSAVEKTELIETRANRRVVKALVRRGQVSGLESFEKIRPTIRNMAIELNALRRVEAPPMILEALAA